MKENPIIFNLDMVRALHNGRKTQTRRIVKHQPPGDGYQIATCSSTTGDRRIEGKHRWLKLDGHSVVDGTQPYFSCPYGYAGDRLWVRENWRVSAWHNHLAPNELPFDHRMSILYAAGGSRTHDGAGRHVNSPDYPPSRQTPPGKGRPSIHMPRAACRTLLDVATVRIERLQDISEADAEAEGVDFMRQVPDADETLSARDLYRILWDHINAARGHNWESNPWVWVVDFQMYTGT